MTGSVMRAAGPVGMVMVSRLFYVIGGFTAPPEVAYMMMPVMKIPVGVIWVNTVAVAAVAGVAYTGVREAEAEAEVAVAYTGALVVVADVGVAAVVAVDMGVAVAVVAGRRSLWSNPPSRLPEVVSRAGAERGVAGYNPRETACRSRRYRPDLAVSACNN